MLKKKDAYVVAVVGATGAVGVEMVSVLEERNFPVSELRLFASANSEGKVMQYKGKDVTVHTLTKDSFAGVDIALFSAGGSRSLEFAPIAAAAGCIVIDNSAAWRMDKDCPLVVPEVNSHHLKDIPKGIIANPNCSTIQMLVALKPLHDAAKITRIVVTTFQSVSGTGKKAMDELMDQTVALLSFKEPANKVYPHRIAFNCLPHIDVFLDNGYTKEEMKMVHETHKMLDPDIKVTATTVRVPVFRCHAESVNIETEKKLTANEARAILAAAPGVIVYDDPSKNLYPLQIDCVGKDDTYVGRVREDESIENGLNLWVVSDNLRKGAALNAVQIAEELIK
ncbi:MAG: aspartate-semialdehyde dehydrogenase [Nitrospirae bacterium]|nr:aspartate-semialdehyde dehydrogenase [Nitrospirota bacterium]MBI5694360.1 aspartate-semialdehyde dehydrogenase [Nitrospirota bacterium]